MSVTLRRTLKWTAARIARTPTTSTLITLQLIVRNRVVLVRRKLDQELDIGTILASRTRFWTRLKRQIQKCSRLNKTIHQHSATEAQGGRMHSILPAEMRQLVLNWPWKCLYLRRLLVWHQLISGTDPNSEVLKKFTISAVALTWRQSLTITCAIVVMINIEIALEVFLVCLASRKCPELMLVTRVIYLVFVKTFTSSSTRTVPRKRMIQITRPLIWARTLCRASWVFRYHASRVRAQAQSQIFQGSAKQLRRKLLGWALTPSTTGRTIIITRPSRLWKGRNCSLTWQKCKLHWVAPSRLKILVRRRMVRVPSKTTAMLRRVISRLTSLIRQIWWWATLTAANRSIGIQWVRSRIILSNWLGMVRKLRERLIRRIRSRVPSSPNLATLQVKVRIWAVNFWVWRPLILI